MVLGANGLSLISSRSWAQSTGAYASGTPSDVRTFSPQKDVSILTAPYASLNYISGDYNILIVHIDTEHKQARARDFDIGRCGVRVPVIGHTLRNFDSIRLPGVHDLVDVFLGLPGEHVAPGGTQLALTKIFVECLLNACIQFSTEQPEILIKL